MKILPIDEISTFLKSLPWKTHPVGQCHGVFDLLHSGHVAYFEEAKNIIGKLGALVVTVTSDKYVCKGANRPIISQNDRLKMVSAIGCVDYACLSDYPSASYSIKKIRPDYFFKGVDYRDETMSVEEKFAVESIGARLIYTTAPKHSTTEIIERCKLS